MVNKVMVPPDGGYGWVIVFATALSNICFIPIIQSFGLLFQGAFDQLGFSHADASVILNVNTAFSMMSGLVHGALLRYYGFRKISVLGSALTSIGVVMTAYAATFWQFLLFYGLISSFGMGLCMSSFSLAVNTYFVKRKGKAISISMTLTGLGPIIMPQLISYLLKIHTVQGATLIIGAVSSHSLIGAFLLQPVKWHFKEKSDDDEKEEEKLIREDKKVANVKAIKEKNEIKDVVKLNLPKNALRSNSVAENDYVNNAGTRQRRTSHRSRSNSIVDSTFSIDHDQEVGSIYGLDASNTGSILSLTSGRPRTFSKSISEDQKRTVNKWWSTPSLGTVNLGSSIQIFDEKPSGFKNGTPADAKLLTENEKKTVLQRIGTSIVNFFDLTLLCDPIYVNIMFGMSLAIFAELNFSVLTPFILADFGLDTSRSATFLSILAVADILFRFFAPYIGDFLKKPPRLMYMFTLTLLIITRSSLLLFSEYYALLGVALGLGVAKGIRTVYMSLVIPTYVPIERLASAAGIQMMVNGMFIMVGGPILGVIRDATGSYRSCIVIMNCITFSCILLWSAEMIYLRIRKGK